MFNTSWASFGHSAYLQHPKHLYKSTMDPSPILGTVLENQPMPKNKTNANNVRNFLMLGQAFCPSSSVLAKALRDLAQTASESSVTWLHVKVKGADLFPPPHDHPVTSL